MPHIYHFQTLKTLPATDLQLEILSITNSSSDHLLTDYMEPLGISIHQEQRHSVSCSLGIWLGLGNNNATVSQPAVGDVDLAAVDDPVISIPFGIGPDPLQV